MKYHGVKLISDLNVFFMLNNQTIGKNYISMVLEAYIMVFVSENDDGVWKGEKRRMCFIFLAFTLIAGVSTSEELQPFSPLPGTRPFR